MSAALASALVLFLAPTHAPSPASPAAESDSFESQLASIPTLSTGILSATQGAYTTAQLLLDMGQGARVSGSAYDPAKPPPLSLAGARVQPWASVIRRAHDAPQLLQPGLLASTVPGGGAYVGIGGQDHADGAPAADEHGRVAAVSLGSQATLMARIERARRTSRLVVADLAAGAAGYAQLRALAAARSARELLIVLQRAPDRPDRALLWVAFGGLRADAPGGAQAFGAQTAGGGRTLTSQTTNQRGLIAAIDLAPTILDHLGLPIPAAMRGRPARLDGPLDGAGLRALKARLEVIGGRRLSALGWMLIAWALLLAGGRLSRRRERSLPRDAFVDRDAHRPQARATRLAGRGERWALRVGALALLWAPAGALATAALEPSRALEYALLIAICFSLAAVSDRLIGWPRAPIAPALSALVAIAVDALAGTQLLMRSLLGPNPAFGARFYGIGNELKSGLAVLVLCAVAGALYPAVRGSRAALAMVGAGAVLAVVEGSARIGAGVGGVILVSAGTAVAAALLLPGALTRRRVLSVMAAPAIGLVALAALDMATAHGSGHFTGSVLHARSAGDLRDVLVRRYGAAWDELRNHLMPLATALALGGGAVGVWRRQRVCAPVRSDPAWLAALGGGLAAGVVGALSEDSGPVLLVVAVFALGCMLAYLWGRPPAREPLPRAVAARAAQHDLVL